MPFRISPALREREQRARELAKQGLAIDPSVGQPRPQGQGSSSFEGCLDFDGSSHLAFTDGGCTRPFHPRLARASWAVVLASPEGKQLAACTGPVWAGLPQSAPCAEAVAAAALSQLLEQATEPVTLVGDNQGVFTTVSSPCPNNNRATFDTSCQNLARTAGHTDKAVDMG